MALYEGLSAEKLAVVLDIGARYSKFGFVGEFSPRCIIPTEIYCTRSEKIRKIFDYENDQDLYALLVAFLHKLYFRHVLVSPKDRHVVVVESLLCPTQFRDTLASVFYRHYEANCKGITSTVQILATRWIGVESTALIFPMALGGFCVVSILLFFCYFSQYGRTYNANRSRCRGEPRFNKGQGND